MIKQDTVKLKSHLRCIPYFNGAGVHADFQPRLKPPKMLFRVYRVKDVGLRVDIEA